MLWKLEPNRAHSKESEIPSELNECDLSIALAAQYACQSSATVRLILYGERHFENNSETSLCKLSDGRENPPSIGTFSLPYQEDDHSSSPIVVSSPGLSVYRQSYEPRSFANENTCLTITYKYATIPSDEYVSATSIRDLNTLPS